MDRRKRVGARIDPCGTPEITGRVEEKVLAILTHWVRLLR